MYCETNVHVECVRWMIVACVVCSACCAEKAFYVFILMSHVIYMNRNSIRRFTQRNPSYAIPQTYGNLLRRYVNRAIQPSEGGLHTAKAHAHGGWSMSVVTSSRPSLC